MGLTEHLPGKIMVLLVCVRVNSCSNHFIGGMRLFEDKRWILFRQTAKCYHVGGISHVNCGNCTTLIENIGDTCQ